MESNTDLETFPKARARTGRSEVSSALDQTAPTVGIGGGVSPTRRVTPIAPETPPPSVCAIVEQAGDRIGPYQLVEPLGEGGFGVVWMAEQSEPIARKVALKVIKAGMDTRDVLARFEVERQALAMMDHTHIARVIDAGATESGRPYFAMELVDGVPITQFCDDAQLDIRQRLELFQSICAAVNHAHQKGIIHRDLKPSNVMVTRQPDDGQPIVKVIDFGVAKATEGRLTDHTLLVTRAEQVLGTPIYMSPEQTDSVNGLDIDTRSDIYSLGVLLYEMLTGRPPFDPKVLKSGGFDEMRRTIREDDPLRPSLKVRDTAAGMDAQKLNRLLRGDLDWIVMKALSKERSRRYETASAFAADIGRFLENEPVVAAAPSASYKFRKFARRNWAAIVVAALFAVVLITTTAVSAWQAVRATQAQEESEQARARASRAQREAKATATFMTALFTSANGNGGDLVETLRRAAQKLETDKSIDPDLKASLQATLADTCEGLGLHLEARRLRKQVRDHEKMTRGPDGDRIR